MKLGLLFFFFLFGGKQTAEKKRETENMVDENCLEVKKNNKNVKKKDRLWQMELLRRLASGRICELLGESALEVDKFARF